MVSDADTFAKKCIICGKNFPAKSEFDECCKAINFGEVSDGYHTFNELYEHRHALFIALCNLSFFKFNNEINLRNSLGKTVFPEKMPWRSKYHEDGAMFPGMFIAGLGRKKGRTISYHMPLSLWDECKYFLTLDKAPEWDGHTSEDVIRRLYKLYFL